LMADKGIAPNYVFFIKEKEAIQHLTSIRRSERERGNYHVLRSIKLYTKHTSGLYLSQTGETYIFLYNWKKISNPVKRIVDLFESIASNFNKKIQIKRDARLREVVMRDVMGTFNHEFYHQLLDQFIGIKKSSLREMYHLEKILIKLEEIEEYRGPYTERKREHAIRVPSPSVSLRPRA